MSETDRELIDSMSDEDFEEHVIKPYEHREKNAKSNLEPIEELQQKQQLEQNKTIETISQLSNTELIQLVADFREYEREHDESLLRELLFKELADRGLEIITPEE